MSFGSQVTARTFYFQAGQTIARKKDMLHETALFVRVVKNDLTV